MKKLSWINKIMFVVNIVLAVLTFVAYVLPFLAPKLFPILSALTLVLPLFLIGESRLKDKFYYQQLYYC